MFDNLSILGNIHKGEKFIQKTRQKNFSFALVISYTDTCTIPGLSIAGSSIDMMKFTPPFDAEFIINGFSTQNNIPMTPDCKLSPAIITRAVLEYSKIPTIIINAGSKIKPNIPYLETGLKHGKNIMYENALSKTSLSKAITHGKMIGKMLAACTNCLILGESIPGGTTTSLAVSRGLGIKARMSSSMSKNPISLKNKIVDNAILRLHSQNPYDIVASLGDPMIPTMASIISSASQYTNVLLAGGTQMIAVLAFANILGYNSNNTAIGTTSYILNDTSANLLDMITLISDIPLFVIDLKLINSKITTFNSYSHGFIKDGAGAGGSTIGSLLKSYKKFDIIQLVENEYHKILSNSY